MGGTNNSSYGSLNFVLLGVMKMKRSKQMSDSIRLGIVLAMAGGFMDAYSYLCRGQVFANAQTGNMLLMGINLAEQNWKTALYYF